MDISSFDDVQELLAKAHQYKQLTNWAVDNSTKIKKGISHEIDIHNIMMKLRKKIDLLVHYIRVYFMVNTKVIDLKLQNVANLTKKYEVIKEHFESKGILNSHSVARARMEALNARNVLFSFVIKDMIAMYKRYQSIKQDIHTLNNYFNMPLITFSE